MPICMISNYGKDAYNHDNMIREVGRENITEDRVEQYFRDYVQYCTKHVRSEEYAWADVLIYSYGKDGVTVLKHWYLANPIKQKVILNKPAQATAQAKKEKVKSLMDEIFAEEMADMPVIQPMPTAAPTINWAGFIGGNANNTVGVQPAPDPNQW